MIRAVRINMPLVDVLAGMPDYGKFLTDFVNNKHKIKQISATFLSDESFAILQNKVPPKLGDPRSFLIPCNFDKILLFSKWKKIVKFHLSWEDLFFTLSMHIDVISEILEEDFDALLDEGSLEVIPSSKETKFKCLQLVGKQDREKRKDPRLEKTKVRRTFPLCAALLIESQN
uniref:Reverse transcriptase domain-containing protein n=1 Tax=Tanacetum cinerariifolium TaxID=118510 RepID=A0A6L2JRN2_TANCI|nr:reverse transcriptase domain-containing protein [Tanacetum cinerariifolium]